MSVSEMMEHLIRAGYVTPRNDNTQAAPLGSYRQVPSMTFYGNVPESAMIAATHAKLEQHPSGN
jgi:hypothetical protein